MADELNDKPANGVNGNGKERPWLIKSGEQAKSMGRSGAIATKDYFAAKIKVPDIRKLRARMDDLEKMMASKPEAQAYDQLSRSYERLFKVWVYLAGFPAPGVKRVAPDRSGAVRGVIDIEPEALPDVVQTQKPASEPDSSPLDNLQAID